MTKKDSQDFVDNLFMQNFLGSEVEIMINLYHKVEQHSGDEMMSQQNPLAMRGFILDIDDEYIYLGETPHAITRFVRKSMIVGGDMVKEGEQGQFDEILNNFSTSGSAN